MRDADRVAMVSSSAAMAVGTIASRLLGFAKVMMLALAVGVTVGGAADAFDIANKIPNTLYMLLAGGVLNAVLVPQLVSKSRQHDGGQDFINRFLTLAVIILIGVTAAAMLCAPLLIRIYSVSTWPTEQTALAVAFAVWCLPQLFFYGLYTLLGQILNARSSFGPYAWAPVANNVVAIIGLGIFIAVFGPGDAGQHTVDSWDAAKIAVLAGSATAGVICQALILITPLRRVGVRYVPTFGFRGRGLGSAGRVAGWAFAGLVVGHLGFIVISQVASSVSSAGEEAIASNAAYSLSYTIFMLPHSIVAVSLATALLPALSRDVADQATKRIRSNLAMSIRVVGLVNVFSAVALIVLRDEVALAVGGGSRAQAEAIGLVIATMAVGLVPFSANYLLQRAFYAYEDGRTPFFIKVPQVLITSAGVVAAAFLPNELVVAGIGTAMSVGYVFAFTLAAVRLRRRIGRLDGRVMLISHLKYVIAGVVAAGVGWIALMLVGHELGGNRGAAFLAVLITIPCMFFVYVVVCRILKVSELNSIHSVIRAKLAHRGSC